MRTRTIEGVKLTRDGEAWYGVVFSEDVIIERNACESGYHVYHRGKRYGGGTTLVTAVEQARLRVCDWLGKRGLA